MIIIKVNTTEILIAILDTRTETTMEVISLALMDPSLVVTPILVLRQDLALIATTLDSHVEDTIATSTTVFRLITQIVSPMVRDMMGSHPHGTGLMITLTLEDSTMEEETDTKSIKKKKDIPLTMYLIFE